MAFKPKQIWCHGFVRNECYTVSRNAWMCDWKKSFISLLYIVERMTCIHTVGIQYYICTVQGVRNLSNWGEQLQKFAKRTTKQLLQRPISLTNAMSACMRIFNTTYTKRIYWTVDYITHQTEYYRRRILNHRSR
jgi:hypothetical protein